MTETTSLNLFGFPSTLIEAQKAAAEAFAALHRFQADPELPWSRGPHEGWEMSVPAHGGALQGYQSSRPATQGWSAEQVREYEALWEACRTRSERVHADAFWERFEGPELVAARQALKLMPGAVPGAVTTRQLDGEPVEAALGQDDVTKAV